MKFDYYFPHRFVEIVKLTKNLLQRIVLKLSIFKIVRQPGGYLISMDLNQLITCMCTLLFIHAQSLTNFFLCPFVLYYVPNRFMPDFIIPYNFWHAGHKVTLCTAKKNPWKICGTLCYFMSRIRNLGILQGHFKGYFEGTKTFLGHLVAMIHKITTIPQILKIW